MLQYHFYEKYYNDEKTRGFLMIELEGKYGALITFLTTDAEVSWTYFKKFFDEFLNGGKECDETNGELCFLEIRRDYTKIVTHWWFDEAEKAEFKEEDLVCKVATSDLHKLLLVWGNALHAYKRDKTILNGGVVA